VLRRTLRKPQSSFDIGDRKGLPTGKWTVEIWNNNLNFASQTFTLVPDR
jgi:hypothetical protein